MPDWIALVRDRLYSLNLPENDRQEVINELAAHLEDLYEEEIAKGLSQSEARERVTQEVEDWLPLARDIQRTKLKEEIMNPRTKQLWLPSLVSLTPAMLSLMSFTLLGVQPHLFYAHHAVTTVYFPWLAALPLCGAAGAYLSRRAGGDQLACLVSSLFPAATLFACFFLILLDSVFGTGHSLTFTSFLLFVWNWVFLPGAALLLGALPLLRPRHQGTRSLA